MLTYPHLSITMDEHLHRYGGGRWWKLGSAGHQKMNPLLSKIFIAAPEYFFPSWGMAGDKAHVKQYLNGLTLRRMGILPFYLASCIGVFVWARQLFGSASVALWSLASYVTTVTVLGLASFAVTDLPYAATFIWALIASTAWLEKPSEKNSVWLGIALALLLSTKFSCIAHFPAAMLGIILLQSYANFRLSRPVWFIRGQHFKRFFFLSIPIVFIVIGLIYRFRYYNLAQGISILFRSNNHEVSHYHFNSVTTGAVWYFYPVILFYKTQLTLMLCFLYANIRLLAGFKNEQAFMQVRRLFPLAAAMGMIGISTMAGYNMGVRHILPVYTVFAVGSGYALYLLWQGQRLQRALAIVLLSYQAFTCWNAYPDYLSYYNELAGSHPEAISWDSDFDWGQSVYQINDALRERNITEVYTCIHKGYVTNEALKLTLPAKDLGCELNELTGWVVVGRSFVMNDSRIKKILKNSAPVAAIGRTNDLYYLPAHESK